MTEKNMLKKLGEMQDQIVHLRMQNERLVLIVEQQLVEIASQLGTIRAKLTAIERRRETVA